MVRKQTLYHLANGVWFLAVAASLVLVVSGNARPYVSPDVIPYGALGAFGAAILLIVAGSYVIGRFEARDWTTMGRAVGLEPDGRSLLGKPDLTGTVDGRAVSVSTYKVKRSSAGDEGSRSATYTLVEAALREQETDGYILGRGDAGSLDDDIPHQVQRKDLEGECYVVGGVSADYGRTVLTGRVQDLLRESTAVDAVVVGNPVDAILSVLPDDVGKLGSMVTSGFESKLEAKQSFDATTVSHNARGAVLDAETLQAQIDAVVVVAGAHEDAKVEAVTV